ncbi:hypothetical protein AB0D49_25960 [Streptomyces sp. NPDC048290]|uniref:hypothetical protein n=1 Tax=Streptomyces sp. NPDC048290 TaxID=3155811 RepID=UPI0034461198
MVSASRAARDIEVTAESLHEDLSRLELQKRALERELAAVAAHLDTVHRALRAFEAVLADPPEAADAADTGRRRDAGRNQADTRSAQASPATPADTTRAARQPRGGKGTAKRAARPKVATERMYGRLTEQILDYFAEVGTADVRARDVAVALGRATDSGSINAIRSTLDRLVGASRIRRTGRGLYRAGPS